MWVYYMSELLEWEWHIDISAKAWGLQVDCFSQELNKFLLDDKLTNREKISNILISDSDLRNWFEEFLKTSNSLLKIKCKRSLQDCNSEEGIKSVISEVIPEWYKVYGNDWVEIAEMIGGISGNSEDSLNSMAEEVVQNEEVAAQDEEVAVQNENESLDNKEKIWRAIETAMNYREDLLIDHPDIDKNSRKKVELVKQQLPEETRNQLKEAGYDDNVINDYILLKVTLNEIKSSSDFDKIKVEQFEKTVNELSALDVFLKKIDNFCNIPDTSLGSFSIENIAQTRSELFNENVWNESLREIKASNLKFRDYNEMFPEIWDDKLIAKYWKFLEWESKEVRLKYQNDLNFKNEIDKARSNPNQSQLKLMYENMVLELRSKKKEMDDETKIAMEELCLISQIKWMYMCMWKWNDYNLNKSNEIETQKIGDEHLILTLKGHIDWVDFSVRQDIKDPGAKLQTSQKLVKSQDGNMFTIGWESNFVDSNFILPSHDEIFKLAVESVNSGWVLDGASDTNEYQELLQEKFMWRVNKLYENTYDYEH